MPRPPKYDWEDKRDICYRLWVEEKLSGNQIVKWFADHFKLPVSALPNANQFHQHFKKWGFPLRREPMPAEQEARLLARVRELFGQYASVQDIQKTLNEEGWDMDDYHFRVFRKKHGMLMRNQKGYKPLPATRKRKRTDGDENVEQGAEEAAAEEAEGENDEMDSQSQPASLPPEEAARRAQRLAELQLQSDELLRTRKRRRRIRGYGHLPPDDPSLQPRYGSETSLDECKAYLQLPNELYVQIRSQFDAICRELGIIKMSQCADGQWQASKDRLIRESPHLSAVLHPLQPDLDKRLNALNCICSDVTKRIRSESKKFSIAEASNILGLDPLQSKELRRVFYEILEADQFTTVVACGKEHLAQLREEWYARSEVLQQAVASGDPQKMRAIDVLNKDARKRYCDDQMKKHPEQRQWQNQKHYGPGPGPAKGVPASKDGKKTNASDIQQPTTPNRPNRRLNIPLGPAWVGQDAPEFRTTTIADMHPGINFDLDPLLSETTHGPPWPPQAPQAPQAPLTAPAPAEHVQAPLTITIPAYFRLAPGSQVIENHPKMWLGKLSSGVNFASLVQAATSKAGAANVAKVSGVVKNQDGGEDSWLIDNDDELGAYLTEAGEKATFVVLLQEAYA